MTFASFRNPKSINVVQGEYAVSTDPEDVLTTVLGSCVAACLYDPVAKVGGMNHFLLPGSQVGTSENMSYGLNAMELLINSMLKEGGRRGRFRAKLFGGARMHEGLTDIGTKNAVFAREFLELEGIHCESESLGGTSARRVRFWPVLGRAQLKIVGTAAEVKSVPAFRPTNVVTTKSSDLELF